MQVVTVWTGRHAMALRTALRLTNEAFAQTLGTATRTVAKWNAQPDLVPVSELQRALDTVLQRASDEAKARFTFLVGDDDVGGGAASTSAELRLADDPAVGQVLAWLDERAGWPPGEARRYVAQLLTNVDRRQLQDRANRRSRVGRSAIASALAGYYHRRVPGYDAYRANCAGDQISTSIITRPDWLDVRLPLGRGRDRLEVEWASSEVADGLDDTSARAAAVRLAEALATGTRIVNTPLYRLLKIKLSSSGLVGSVAITEFITYALTLDLLENELIDALAERKPARPGSLTLRDRYLPTLSSVVNVGQRLCAGGALALFAAARPAGGRRRHGDYVLLVQERSGRVLNAARRLAVIPKSFHEPLIDYVDEAQLAAKLERGMEEELFRRSDSNSTNGGHKP